MKLGAKLEALIREIVRDEIGVSERIKPTPPFHTIPPVGDKDVVQTSLDGTDEVLVHRTLPVPEELVGLEGYATDQKLLERWGELLESWRAAFPGVDIKAEIAKAYAWEQSNPSRKKTPRGRPRFLYSWFERAQNAAVKREARRTGEDYSWMDMPAEGRRGLQNGD